jgi:tripartite ATP-independent transporter DctP family solute receptor
MTRTTMTRTLSIIAAVAFAVVGLVGGAEAQVTVLKFAHQNNPGHPIAAAADKFKELVESRSDGKVKITVFPSSQLGGMNDLWNGVKLGSVEISGTIVLAMADDLVPELGIYDAPYLFEDVDHFQKVAYGPIGQKMNAELLEKGGVRILYLQYFGSRHLTTNKPIYKPDDVKGMKIRAPAVPSLMAPVEGMGAIPTPMPLMDVYQALQTGLVDGQENPVTTIYSNRFHEVQKYVMLTGHVFGIVGTLINESVFQKLPADMQKVLLEAGEEAGKYGDAVTVQQEVEMVDKLKAYGTEIIGPENGLDLEAFRTQIRAYAYKKFEDKWPQELIDGILALAK